MKEYRLICRYHGSNLEARSLQEADKAFIDILGEEDASGFDFVDNERELVWYTKSKRKLNKWRKLLGSAAIRNIESRFFPHYQIYT